MILHEFVRVAIIWQQRSSDKPLAELYIYDVPLHLIYGPSWVSDGSLTFIGNPDDIDDLSNYYVVQGKRVTSLDPRVGGVHRCSLLWDLSRGEGDEMPLPKQASLGGLQFPHGVGSRDSSMSYYPKIQYQKCFLWGPGGNTQSTSIMCKIFDFSFAHPARLHRRDGLGIQSLIWINERHCACALHDESFRILLPSVQSAIKPAKSGRRPSSQRRESSFWPWKSKCTPAIEADIGSLSQVNPPAREAALLRRHEWFRDHIRGMKRAGLSEFEIAELWGCAAWTQYEQIRCVFLFQCNFSCRLEISPMGFLAPASIRKRTAQCEGFYPRHFKPWILRLE